MRIFVWTPLIVTQNTRFAPHWWRTKSRQILNALPFLTLFLLRTWDGRSESCPTNTVPLDVHDVSINFHPAIPHQAPLMLLFHTANMPTQQPDPARHPRAVAPEAATRATKNEHGDPALIGPPLQTEAILRHVHTSSLRTRHRVTVWKAEETLP